MKYKATITIEVEAESPEKAKIEIYDKLAWEDYPSLVLEEV